MKNRKIWAYVAAVTVALSVGTFFLGCRNGNVAADGTYYPEIERWWK